MLRVSGMDGAEHSIFPLNGVLFKPLTRESLSPTNQRENGLLAMFFSVVLLEFIVVVVAFLIIASWSEVIFHCEFGLHFPSD